MLTEMALELGLAALKALYQLAKMIKEAKDNVEFIGQRLHITESIEEVIQLQLTSMKPEAGGDGDMEAIHEATKDRVVRLQRACRRMKLKYKPLIGILAHLGGASSVAKDMTGKLCKGLQSAVMALGCLSVMMRKRGDREKERALRTFEAKLARLASASDSSSADTEGESESETDDAALAAREEASAHLDKTRLELAHMSEALDGLDALLATLRRQDEALMSALQDTDGGHDKHKAGYNLLPTYTKPKKSSFDPASASNSDLLLSSSSPYSSSLSHPTPQSELRQQGARLLLTQLFCADTSPDTVDEHMLQKALGRGYTPSGLAFLRRQLGEVREGSGAAKVISRERMERLLLVDGKDNAGFDIALCCSSALVSLDRQLDEVAAELADVPGPLAHTRHITDTIIKPLVGHALATGLVLQLEKLRDSLADDPDEAAHRDEEADDGKMEGSLQLLETFATDFAEAFEHNLSPDASLLVSIAIDAGDAKAGLGPSTRRRLELLMAILSICNIESDKAALEQVEADLRSEVALLSAASNTRLQQSSAALQQSMAADLEVGIGLSTKIHELYSDMMARDSYRRFGISASIVPPALPALPALPTAPASSEAATLRPSQQASPQRWDPWSALSNSEQDGTSVTAGGDASACTPSAVSPDSVEGVFRRRSVFGSR